MKAFLFYLYLIFSTACPAQIFLTITETGDNIKNASYELVDFENSPFIKLNDSSRKYELNIKTPESLFIGINEESGWFTRIWLDPLVKSKEIIINYSLMEVIVKNPGPDDLLFDRVFSAFIKGEKKIADSLMFSYVANNPDSYLSLYFVSHGLFIDYPEKRIAALMSLDQKFQNHPDFIRTKLSLTSRRYPEIGESFKEFTLPDFQENNFNSFSVSGKCLVRYSHKWILLHFWSNACKPCVREMDSLSEFYRMIDTSMLEFISVGIDEKFEGWKNGDATRKISWINVWQPGGGVGDLCLNYNVHSMPFFLVFDNRKKLVSIRYGSDELKSLEFEFKAYGLIK